MQPYSVIVRPVLSEKSTGLREVFNQYTFQVNKLATKQDIANAVKAIWGVDVEKVTTNIRRTKIKRRGPVSSEPKTVKFAFVRLAKAAKLPLFEDQ